jgi:RHS repeat-associated protein
VPLWNLQVGHVGVADLGITGHGSVRQQADGSGNALVYQYDPDGAGGDPPVDYTGFDYDAYGVALTPLPFDGLYYTGEMYDSSASMYYLRARWYDQQTGRFNRIDPFVGHKQDPQSLHKYLYCHANPVNNVDPSGRYLLFGGALVKIVVVIAIIFILYLFATRHFRSGLQHRLITDADIVASIEGMREADQVINDTIEPTCPANWAAFVEALEEHGVYQVGQYWIFGGGVVGEGLTLSPGRMQILRYFESPSWNAGHPEASEHPSPAVFGNTEEYIRLWVYAESKRLRIMISELEEEARRREIAGYTN